MDFIVIYLVRARSGAYTAPAPAVPGYGAAACSQEISVALEPWALCPGYADSFGIVPDSILAPIQTEARAVFPIVFCKETGVVWLIL